MFTNSFLGGRSHLGKLWGRLHEPLRVFGPLVRDPKQTLSSGYVLQNAVGTKADG